MGEPSVQRYARDATSEQDAQGEWCLYEDHQHAIAAAVSARDNEWCKMLGFCEAGGFGNTPDFIGREIDHEYTKLDVEADLDRDGKVRLLRDIRQAIDSAVSAERERCADLLCGSKVHPRLQAQPQDICDFTVGTVLHCCRKLIRALPEVPDEPHLDHQPDRDR